jgi:hypothetical protein
MTPAELLELWKKKSALHSKHVYDNKTMIIQGKLT